MLRHCGIRSCCRLIFPQATTYFAAIYRLEAELLRTSRYGQRWMKRLAGLTFGQVQVCGGNSVEGTSLIDRFYCVVNWVDGNFVFTFSQRKETKNGRPESKGFLLITCSSTRMSSFICPSPSGNATVDIYGLLRLHGDRVGWMFVGKTNGHCFQLVAHQEWPISQREMKNDEGSRVMGSHTRWGMRRSGF